MSLWSDLHTNQLISLVEKQGENHPRDWSAIAQHFPGRTPGACSRKWARIGAAKKARKGAAPSVKAQAASQDSVVVPPPRLPRLPRLPPELGRPVVRANLPTSRPVQRERKHKKADFDAMVLSSDDEEDVPVEKKSKKIKSKKKPAAAAPQLGASVNMELLELSNQYLEATNAVLQKAIGFK